MIPRRHLITMLASLPAARARADVIPAINTDGDQLGDPLDRSDFIEPSFATDFSAMPRFRTGLLVPSNPKPLLDPAFEWTSAYTWGKPSRPIPTAELGKPLKPSFSEHPGELASYPNADAIAAAGYSPFSVANGILTITADHTPASMLPLIPPGLAPDYTSGAMNSYPFSQTYGYFEMRGRLPRGKGTWPAFWLVPHSLKWPPELDVMEVLGQDPTVSYSTVHSVSTGPHQMFGHPTHGVDLSQDFHTFGMDWGPQRIRFYLDDRLTFSYPTPADCHIPFYLIANLAIGGPKSWPGAPDATTVFPAHLEIAHIKAWQRRAYV